MRKYQLGQEFLLNQDVDIDTSTVRIQAKGGSKVEIIEIDHMDNEFPYKAFFEGADNWIYLSEDELEDITMSSMVEY